MKKTIITTLMALILLATFVFGGSVSQNNTLANLTIDPETSIYYPQADPPQRPSHDVLVKSNLEANATFNVGFVFNQTLPSKEVYFWDVKIFYNDFLNCSVWSETNQSNGCEWQVNYSSGYGQLVKTQISTVSMTQYNNDYYYFVQKSFLADEETRYQIDYTPPNDDDQKWSAYVWTCSGGGWDCLGSVDKDNLIDPSWNSSGNDFHGLYSNTANDGFNITAAHIYDKVFPDLETHTLRHYHFDNDLDDASPFDYDCVTGTGNFSGTSKFGGYSFNPTNDGCSPTANTSVFYGAINLTADFWIRPTETYDTVQPDHAFFFQARQVADERFFMAFSSSSDQVRCCRVYAGGGYCSEEILTLNANQWYHLRCEYREGRYVEGWVDDHSMGIADVGSFQPIEGSNKFRIGEHPDQNWEFKGLIDEMRFISVTSDRFERRGNFTQDTLCDANFQNWNDLTFVTDEPAATDITIQTCANDDNSTCAWGSNITSGSDLGLDGYKCLHWKANMFSNGTEVPFLKSVNISYDASVPDTTFTVSIPVGFNNVTFRPPNFSSKWVEPDGQEVGTGFFTISNQGNTDMDFYMQIQSTISNILVYASNTVNFISPIVLTTANQIIKSALSPSSDFNIWLRANFTNTLGGEQTTTAQISGNASSP